MSESSGILMSGIGQSLIQFADIQYDTKISSLEAEAQRQKEIRLQEMQVSRDAITDSFRLADLESSQERLRLAQETSNLAQEKFDYEKEKDLDPDYVWKAQNVYGKYTVEETDNYGDPVIKEKMGIIGQKFVGINKKDPDDIRILNMDGTMTSGTTADVEVDLLEGTADDPKVTEVSFAEYEAAYAKTDPKYTGSAEDKQKLRLMGEARGITFIDSTAAGVPSAAETSTTGSATGEQSATDQGSDSAASPDATTTRRRGAPASLLGTTTSQDSPDATTTRRRGAPASLLGTTTSQDSPDATTTFPEFEAINTGGQSVPELPPEPDWIKVNAQEMSEVFAYDAARSKSFVEDLIKEMQAVNISQEDIRKELLSILGEIPKEQANGDFAKAVANAYYEFTKGTN